MTAWRFVYLMLAHSSLNKDLNAPYWRQSTGMALNIIQAWLLCSVSTCFTECLMMGKIAVGIPQGHAKLSPLIIWCYRTERDHHKALNKKTCWRQPTGIFLNMMQDWRCVDMAQCKSSINRHKKNLSISLNKVRLIKRLAMGEHCSWPIVVAISQGHAELSPLIKRCCRIIRPYLWHWRMATAWRFIPITLNKWSKFCAGKMT